MENPARVGVERPVARWQEHALFNSVKERCGRTRTSKKGLTGFEPATQVIGRWFIPNISLPELVRGPTSRMAHGNPTLLYRLSYNPLRFLFYLTAALTLIA